jgi:protein-S-isoprenylcysteine O-methyltransferase Ste14
MEERVAAMIAAVCLTVYWVWVVVKLVRLGRKLGKDPNAMPRELIGILLRVAWYPCVIVLLVGLWLAAARHGDSGKVLLERFWHASDWGMIWWIVTGVASLLCIGCTVFTFVCWRKMGRSWRIGIDPHEKLELVSTGPYRYVRHPIYAMRMVINVCACLMAPTPLVVAGAGIDFLLLQIEARREERYMESTHGVEYARYKNSVGRFIPRAFVV